MCPSDVNQAIRQRLGERMERMGYGDNASALARDLGESRKTVRRYLDGDTSTIPAEFLARCEAAGFATVRWLATGEGPEDPRAQAASGSGSDYLARIGELVDEWRGLSSPVGAAFPGDDDPKLGQRGTGSRPADTRLTPPEGGEERRRGGPERSAG